MAGYLGDQYLMSGETLGAVAEYPDSLVMDDGTVLTVSITGNGAFAEVWSFDPATGTSTRLSTLGAEPYSIGWVRMDSPTLVANSDGGYSVIVDRPVGYDYAGAGDDRLVMQRYDASGNEIGGMVELEAGWIDTPNVVDTGNGFFVGERNRRPDDGEPEYSGKFFNESGKLLKTIDFATAAPSGVGLDNGNAALGWRDTSGVHIQVFKSNGKEVSSDTILPGTDVTTYDDRPVQMAALADGGFVALYKVGGFGFPAPDPKLHFQSFKANGVARGKEVTLVLPDMKTTGFPDTSYDIAEMGDGNFVIAWHQTDPNDFNGRDSDILFGVYAPDGTEIFGPQIAASPPSNTQGAMDLVTMADGNVMITFQDDNVKQFHYIESTQGVIVKAPDYYWQGKKGDDSKTGTGGDDVMLGQKGDDSIFGDSGEDYIKGGGGDDSIAGQKHADELLGENGNDTLEGGKGADTLTGGEGKDSLDGGDGDDLLQGEVGADTIRGGDGNDTAYGGDGNDDIKGDGGSDLLYGDRGDDTLSGGAEADSIYAGDGADQLNGQDGNDALYGQVGKDTLKGGDGIDILSGGEGKDKLRGGNDGDVLTGGDGNDKLFGDGGNDTLQSDDGNDKMTGGAGADTFQFLSPAFGQDHITDFEAGTDVLDMGIVAQGLDNTGGGDITASDVAGGVKFAVDADNFVILDGVDLADLTEGTDYIITNPFVF